MTEKKVVSRAMHSPSTFGLLIGLSIFVVFLLLGRFTDLLSNMETQVMDLHFNLKQSLVRTSDQEGSSRKTSSPKISKDIIIVGIESRTLDELGRWPFPRSYHADLLNAFSRISNQGERESVVLLDILFNDVADRAYEDVVLLDAIEEHGRVALQTQVFSSQLSSARQQEHNSRLDTLIANSGEVSNIRGDLASVPCYYGTESPLIPYGRAVAAYGHASYQEDLDQVYRRQQIVSRYGKKAGEYWLDELTLDTDFGVGDFGHLAWTNRDELFERTELPLTAESLEKLKRDVARRGLPRIVPNEDGTDQSVYYVSAYEDHYLPAITLTLALEYFNRTIDQVEVVYGSHILIPNPEKWNPDAGSWDPYSVPVGISGRSRVLNEIRIPIDGRGNMLINFMGGKSSPNRNGIQTYPIRSYAAYAAQTQGSDPAAWPKTKRLGGKILMVGAFTLGMADDEKTTPVGLMFGVEIHANALNTIIMDNFIHETPPWLDSAIMLLLVLGFAFMTARMKNLGWSFGVLFIFVVLSFGVVTITFEFGNLLFDWGTPVIAVLITYISVVIFRILTAERDKRQIKNVFGQFISPSIVDQLSESPPELGGEDVDVTVFFSDIRGFSQISERLSAQDLVRLLNQYLTDMTNNLVNDFEGTLDKYIGDAIMAFWGAPRPQEDHAVRACKCALMQIQLLEQLNNRLGEEAGEDAQRLRIGVGLNSGTCMVGYMGSEGRKNYTAMGDTVNLASRLEGVNKTYQTQIIISEDTYEKIQGHPFIFRELDLIRVKGRNTPVTIYELAGYEGSLREELDSSGAEYHRKRKKQQEIGAA